MGIDLWARYPSTKCLHKNKGTIMFSFHYFLNFRNNWSIEQPGLDKGGKWGRPGIDKMRKDQSTLGACLE